MIVVEQVLRLDLGAGSRVEPGFCGVDISPDCDAEFTWDLRKTPWPWDDESVTEARCSHFLEHLTGDERMPFMDELWRVLKPGALATVIVPYWTSPRSVMDPTHAWPPITQESFLYFDRVWREREKLTHYPIRCNFSFTFWFTYRHDVEFTDEDHRNLAAKHYNNVIEDMIIKLVKEP